MIRSPRILWIAPLHIMAAPEYFSCARLINTEESNEDILGQITTFDRMIFRGHLLRAAWKCLQDT
jgi:hypothetical protein